VRVSDSVQMRAHRNKSNRTGAAGKGAHLPGTGRRHGAEGPGAPALQGHPPLDDGRAPKVHRLLLENGPLQEPAGGAAGHRSPEPGEFVFSYTLSVKHTCKFRQGGREGPGPGPKERPQSGAALETRPGRGETQVGQEKGVCFRRILYIQTVFYTGYLLGLLETFLFTFTHLLYIIITNKIFS